MKRLRHWLKALGARRETWRASNKDRFSVLFSHERWVSIESASGPGSDRGSPSVLHALRVLDEVTETFGIRSIADVPCGDFNWIGEFLNRRPQIDYVGYDIVEDLVIQNRAKSPLHRFELLDITTQVPPPADLIFSKDLVNHMFERDVWATLRNMAASGSRYLMITSNAGSANSELDLRTPRSSRPLDLSAPPYRLPTPIYADHYLSMWQASDVVAALRAANTGSPD